MKFMQIFGNCNNMFYLGSDRVKGPVDNVVCKKAELVEKLCTNKYYDYLHDERYKLIRKSWAEVNNDDSEFMFDFDLVTIAHNNILKGSFWTNIRNRCDFFKEFMWNVHANNNNYGFVVSLNRALVNQDYNTPLEEMYTLLNILSKRNLLDKTIFVQFDEPNVDESIDRGVYFKWNCKIDNWGPLQKLYDNKLKVITIKHGSYDKNLSDDLHNQFLTEFNKLN